MLRFNSPYHRFTANWLVVGGFRWRLLLRLAVPWISFIEAITASSTHRLLGLGAERCRGGVGEAPAHLFPLRFEDMIKRREGNLGDFIRREAEGLADPRELGRRVGRKDARIWCTS